MTQPAPDSLLNAVSFETPQADEWPRDDEVENGTIGIKATQLRGIKEYQDIDRQMTAAETQWPRKSSLILSSLGQTLSELRRENDLLRISNEELTRALAESAQRGSEARRLAHHDVLTGLPNRRLLMERLQRELATATQKKRQLALLFIDLNDFKAVNDRHGHAVGDKLLTAVAARITSCIRTEDIACRYGGDEFVVLLSNLSNPLYPSDGEHSEDLLSYADALMYRNKPARYERVTLAQRLSNLRKLLQRPIAAAEQAS
jgi:GGDEF domain-containing protein